MGGNSFYARIVVGFRLLVVTLLVILYILPGSPARAATPIPTGAEPILVSDLDAGPKSSSPSDLVAIGTTLFFSASDGLSGRELWRTSPPYSSTQRVADICPGGCSSSPTYLAAVGTTLFFNATDGKNGYELWYSSPPYTQATTFQVADININGDASPQEMTAIGSSVFFTADDGSHGRELWRSDQPYHSATLIRDIFPGDAGSSPHNLVRIGWMLFFLADDSTGSEVWRTDPPYNASSTYRLTNLNPYGSSNPQELTSMGLKLFFSANDGENGQELYLIESPYLEAKRVTDLAGNPPSSNPTGLLPIGDQLFFTASIGFNGPELFRSDPPYESTTTYLVRDINKGFFGSNPHNKAAVGNIIFFAANDAKHGFELWRSNPPYNPDTTKLVLDINKGNASSNPQALTAVGTTLFFTANDGEFGYELWKSEPPYIETTTVRVADINRGGASSDPHSMHVIDTTLFFAATNEADGKELWRIGGFFGMPATGFAPGIVSRVAPQPASKAYQEMDGLTLELPALNIQAEIVGVPPSPEGWDLSWLANQVGYLTGTAYPTWTGNTVLTAHVYKSDGKPGPFANLGKLGWGSQVILRAYGQRYIYEVREVQSVAPTQTEAVFKHEERAWLTLVTCKDYDEQKGEYRARLVVRAVLVKVEPIG